MAPCCETSVKRLTKQRCSGMLGCTVLGASVAAIADCVDSSAVVQAPSSSNRTSDRHHSAPASALPTSYAHSFQVQSVRLGQHA